jgi:hypothetical protein
MHPHGPPSFHNVAATKAAAEAAGVGVVDIEDAEDVEGAEDVVDAVCTVETEDPETVTKVCPLVANLIAILHMPAESANTDRREETMEMMCPFASSAGSQATSK